MPRCQYCGEKIGEDVVFCPKCGEILVEEDTERQGFQIQEKVDEAKDRANMYIILATVLVTVGMMGSSLFLVSSSLLGFLGIAFVCFGIGCTASADRYKRKARSLENQLSDKAS
ncbi:MAG TPA: zinc ribbon domain-containing protein [Dehalococcoidia bacterium]|nr:zinc ribbon domain-containing protein [Dehalococcoidia bacterium]